ncbi:MAG: response regulator transcription factor [Peptococcaceae bacterium]|nr:response regulator transcription factor [Peptococcaceae bacterium]
MTDTLHDSAPQVLIVDDNSEIREILSILLSGEGFIPHESATGSDALIKIQEMPFDLIILDVMMPDLDGYHTCLAIREHTNVPILFLSAKTQEQDKVLGFASGGDDYIEKPFSYNELMSRAKALVRRYHVYQGRQKNTTPVYRIDDLTIDTRTASVNKAGTEIALTDLEYAILLLLVQHRGQIFSATHLFETVWQEPYYHGANNTVMVHIRNLRRKIENDPANPKIIRTVWGRGYRCE